jgi:hypothetical protein
MAGDAVSFEQAFAKIAQELKQAAGGKKSGFQALKASGGQVSFKIPLNQTGKGKAETEKRCFGITLDCEATITGPAGVYNVQVGTSAGSQYKFEKLTTGKPVKFKLETEGGFSSTVFAVDIDSAGQKSSKEVLVALAYSY